MAVVIAEMSMLEIAINDFSSLLRRAIAWITNPGMASANISVLFEYTISCRGFQEDPSV